MELELELTQEAAARLPRLRAILARKLGRAQSRPMRQIWHDGADSELAKTGLALVETRTQWRLERLRPTPGEIWPPGARPPLLAADESLEALARHLSTPLPHRHVPWAAFEGRALRLSLKPAGAPAELVPDPGAVSLIPVPIDEPSLIEPVLIESKNIELTLIEGRIRTVERESPQCRLMIAGPGDEVAALTLWLAGEIELSVPTSSVAERALTAARGREAAPRQLGAPVLAADMSVAGAFAHIVGHLADVILHFAPIAAAGLGGPEPVHQMRVATRRLRSAIAVFSRAIGGADIALADAGLKQLARTLGPARDWDVFTSGTGAAVGRAFAGDEAVGKLLDDAERQRVSGYDALRHFVDAPEFRQLGIRLALIAARFDSEIGAAGPSPVDDPEPARSLPEFACRALGRRLKRLFAEGTDIDHLDTPALHDIRLRAKRLRYACEFFTPVFPHKATRRFIRRLSVLQDRLGLLNDGAVTADLLARLERTGQKPGSRDVSRAFAIGTVRGFVAAQGDAAREEIFDAWRKFQKAAPFWE